MTSPRVFHERALVTGIAAGVSLLLATGCALLREIGSSSYGAAADVLQTPAERTATVHDVEIACSRGTLNYIIPVEGGVVLVDAGFEEDGEAILGVLAGRKVLAVLLTHAHIDHRAAAHVFGAPVYVGEADLPWFVDDWYLHAVGPAAGRRVWDKPPKPDDLRGVVDKQPLDIGGVRFTAHAVPGHTPGSTAWQFRDVLFTGDAVQSPSGDDIFPAPWTVTEDRRRAWKSVRTLLDVDFKTLFDGHYGRADDAKRLVRAALGELDDEYPYAYAFLPKLGCAESANPH